MNVIRTRTIELSFTLRVNPQLVQAYWKITALFYKVECMFAK